jgi:hypothetical protein
MGASRMATAPWKPSTSSGSSIHVKYSSIPSAAKVAAIGFARPTAFCASHRWTAASCACRRRTQATSC